tara:strand:- start:449 stop:670 length:222 start_codon:yes stop_codon:yes gene_type:complete
MTTQNTNKISLILDEINDGALEYWINWNYTTTGVEWMDDEENCGLQHNAIYENKIDEKLEETRGVEGEVILIK